MASEVSLGALLVCYTEVYTQTMESMEEYFSEMVSFDLAQKILKSLDEEEMASWTLASSALLAAASIVLESLKSRENDRIGKILEDMQPADRWGLLVLLAYNVECSAQDSDEMLAGILSFGADILRKSLEEVKGDDQPPPVAHPEGCSDDETEEIA